MPRSLAIELNEADAKVVQLHQSKKGELELESAFQVSFEHIPKDDNALAEKARRLRDKLREYKVAVAEDVVIILPKQCATVRKVTLPSADADEVASMVEFEAEKIIPFNVERHIIDYQLAGDYDVKGTDVIVAAIDAPVMQGWLDLCTAAGIEPTMADVSSLALSYGLLKNVEVATQKGTFIAIQVGLQHTDITLYQDGQVIWARSVMHGVRHLERALRDTMHLKRDLDYRELDTLNLMYPHEFTLPGVKAQPAQLKEDEDTDFLLFDEEEKRQKTETTISAIRSWVKKLVQNIQRTYEFGIREYSIGPIQKIFISGEGSIIPGFADILQKHFGVKGEVFNPTDMLPVSHIAKVEENDLPVFACSYGAALRCIRGEHRESINLLPPEIVAKQIQSERMVHYIVTGSVALIALVMLFMFISSHLEHQRILGDNYSQYISDMDDLLQEVDDKESRMDIIRTKRSDKGGALEILEGISNYPVIGPSPQGSVTMTRFDYKLGEVVRVDGHAMEISNINEFVKYLKTLEAKGEPIFQSVDIRSQNPTNLPRRDRKIYQFQIEGILGE